MNKTVDVAAVSVRRQARGERRMEEILDAAADLLGEIGYSRLTTNGVAARAGVSPGSLYQYFRNKEAIVGALARRYVAVFDQALARAFPADAEPPTPEEAAGRMVEALVTMNLRHPALAAVFRDLDPSPELVAALAPLRDGIQARAEALARRMAPQLTAPQARDVAAVGGRMFQALSRLVLDAPPRKRAAMKAEVKRAIGAYMARVQLDARA